MQRILCSLALASVMALNGFAATNNSGNPPTFLWLDICTNGIGDSDGAVPLPRMEPDVFDIGVDIGADGTIDRWLSQERTEYLGRDNANEVSIGSWRRFYMRLDEFAGQTAKIRIVDLSDAYYIAVNAIRLNYADGTVVPNDVPNGWFEDETPLNGWSILEGSVTDPASLITADETGDLNMYSTAFFSSRTDVFSGDNSETVVIESDEFTLTPMTSHIYGMVSGGGSEFWNIPDAGLSDNASGVFLDIEPLNGEFDEGQDIPLTAFYGGTADGVRNQMHPVIFNTSGQEGKQCQIVAIDNSEFYHIGLDSFRMNWDVSIIRNGGFDEGIPTPEDDPNATEWFSEQLLEHTLHPSGSIPGWTVESEFGDVAYFFDDACHSSQFSGRTFIGTAGSSEGRFFTGVTLISDPFTITALPDQADSVFLQFASAQGAARERYTDDGSSKEHGTVELHVDVNQNGTFGDDGDYVYKMLHQGMGQNLNTSNMDLWTYPEYRFYIMPEHQGLEAQIFIEDTMGPSRGSYGWMCVDDFYVWTGNEAVLPFPNSDFELGSMENWTEETNTNGGQLESWLSGSAELWFDGLICTDSTCAAGHVAMNNRHGMADGTYAADSAPNEYANGDAGTGSLTSVAFTLPSAGSNVTEWSLH